MMIPFLMLALASAPVRCNLNALTPEERMEQSNAFKHLLPLFVDRKELADGYRLSGPAIPLQFSPSGSTANAVAALFCGFKWILLQNKALSR